MAHRLSSSSTPTGSLSLRVQHLAVGVCARSRHTHVVLFHKEHQLQLEKGQGSLPCTHSNSECSELRRQAPETNLDILTLVDVHINQRQGVADLVYLQGVVSHRQVVLS
jgi:hypothetical protein